MLRPLERYDPSKGYLDSELEVGNKATKEHASSLKGGGRAGEKAEQE